MCGACGTPHDPDGHRVSGPRRRRAVAGAVRAARPGVTVRAVPGGWTVSAPTGATRVARTLDELLRIASPPDARDALRATVLAAADAG